MKIFENKVGRPSNEMKLIRKMFYISVVSIIISLVAIILSCIATVKNVADKSKGATSTPTINSSSNDGKKVADEGSWTNLWEYKATGKYTITYAVKNNSSNSVYYRYFAFDGKSGSLDYNGKDKNGKFSDDPNTCNLAISKSKTSKINKTINLSSNSKVVRSVLKLYNSKTDCSNDNKGKNSSVAKLEMQNRVVTGSSNSSSSSDLSWLTDFFSWIGNFFKNLFEKLADLFTNAPSTGSNKTTTKASSQKTTKPAAFTPPVSTSLKMTVPSNGDIKHDIAVSCNTTVYAPFSGTATYTTKYYNGKTAGYGNVIEIKSSDGVYKVKLAHLNSFVGYTVLYGNAETGISCGSVSCQTKTYGSKSVKQGDNIGKTGSSGNSTGCHLHIELYKNGSKVDPSKYFGY